MEDKNKPHSYINESGHLVVCYHNNGIFMTLAFNAQQTIDLLDMLKEKERYIRKRVANEQ